MRSALLSIAAILLAAAPANASPRTTATSSRALVLHPLSLVRINDLDFGDLSRTAAGTATINPNTGAITTTGGVLSLGGTVLPARFAGAAGSPGAVKVNLPATGVLITRVGGTETMLVDSWTVTGAPPGQLSRREAFTFSVGATLHVSATQAEGSYAGSFNITVDYR